ncbi:hypothetical protein [Oculatella sp. LEGE 06141]|nr:hypothetical protein [Oculatella sp. LEGE 06141]
MKQARALVMSGGLIACKNWHGVEHGTQSPSGEVHQCRRLELVG